MSKASKEDGKLTRIAIVNGDKCKPKKCVQECKRSCPVVRMGKLCIEVEPTSKLAWISEELCIGCGICVKKCFAPYTQILMADGRVKRAEEVKLGEEVMGDDGRGRRVELTVKGEEEMWEVKPKKGRSFVVTGDHVLVLKKVDEKGEVVVEMTVEEWRQMEEEEREKLVLFHVGVEVEGAKKEEELPMPPYEVAQAIAAGLPLPESLFSSPSSSSSSSSSPSSSPSSSSSSSSSSLLPLSYKLSSRSARFSLLAGLLDSLPSVHLLSTNVWKVRVERKEVAEEVESLVLSLGAMATVEKREEEGEWEVEVEGVNREDMPRLTRHFPSLPASPSLSSSPSSSSKSPSSSSSLPLPPTYQPFSVTSLGLSSFCGFTTYPGNQRILLSDYTVTHQCPFEAITIINLPKNLDKDTTHRYGPNSFKLHRLPMPRPGQVLGLVGTNGIGKSTALTILAGKLKPNLGRFKSPPDWQEILTNFRGSELQNFFTKLLEDNIKAIIKPQYVDSIPRSVKGKVGEIIERKNDRKVMAEVCEVLELGNVMDREIANLSGGELQRFAIATTCVQRADMYMFDEPSSYLDVRQRLRAAQAIRDLCENDNYVIAVEHDLSVLDYLSDFVCCLYGQPGVYGVVTAPFSVREGINIFLAGFIPTENLRFRTEELTFKVAENVQSNDSLEQKRASTVTYPTMVKTLGDFRLEVKGGGFTESEIIVMLGQNGTGKTTLVKMLAGLLEPDSGSKVPVLNVSYKPQKIAPKFEGTVRQLLHTKIKATYTHPQFVTDVMKPMRIEELIDQEVKNLSGGELQRVALVLALGKSADIYLLDEPSAYLDSEQRIVASKVIKRYILHAKKTAFVVEHDFIMATYLADSVIVYEGIPAKDCTANAPQPLLSGMNAFLKDLEITFRRDPSNHRPRINKLNSVKDKEQKLAGTFFYLDEDGDDEAPMSKADRKKKEKQEAEAKKDEQREKQLASKKQEKKERENPNDEAEK